MEISGTLCQEHDDEPLELAVNRIINAGWTGRNDEEVQRHIKELKAEGVEPPSRTPMLYPKPRHALTTETEIQVMSDATSGEAEVAFYLSDDEVYITVGSDHTDRDLEGEDVVLSKMVCPNIVGDEFWPLSEVKDHWDELEIKSWTGSEADPDRYQTATLEQILPPEELLSILEGRTDPPHTGTLLFSGSVGTDGGELRTEPYFKVELFDPVLERTLSTEYTTEVIDWHSP